MKPGLLAVSLVCFTSLAACGTKPGPGAPPATGSSGEIDAPLDLEPSALQKRLAAMTPATWESRSVEAAKLSAAVEAFFDSHPMRRGYIAVDKPLYRPGETIWFRAFDLGARDLSTTDRAQATFQLVSPKGAPVITKRVQVEGGNAANDFEIPLGVPGGEYLISLSTSSGLSLTRPVVVSSYQPPRIKKTVKFLRKAYGPGDKVAAALHLERATGEALASQDVSAVVRVDGVEVTRMPLATDIEGRVVVRFVLPQQIGVGDGLLTILVNDGGVTESVQKRIPIALKNLAISLYPEGGQLVAGLPGRVYVAAKNSMGKPADIEAVVVDDRGAVVSRFRSIHDGMGRFEITPEAGRSYHVVVEKPVGIETRAALPSALASGCVMQSIDDFESKRDDVRVALWCSSEQKVVATASLRERTLATASVMTSAGEPTIVALPQSIAGDGAVRVTIFDARMRPLAERLVYRSGVGEGMSVAIAADRDSYNPRDKVTLAVKTRDAAGAPVAADLALTVVDDTVLSFADDKTAALKARVLLEAEMPGQTIEEPNFYFSDDPLAAAGRDLVLGTHGWRRFDWEPVFPQERSAVWGVLGRVARRGLGRGSEDPDAVVATKNGAEAIEREAAPAMRPGDVDKPDAKPVVVAQEMAKDERQILVEGRIQKPVMDEEDNFDGDDDLEAGGRARAEKEDRDWKNKKKPAPYRWAPVRQFPVPSYNPDYTGPRNDFRETVYWQPQLKTDADGNGTVSFYTSDSVTAFRAIAEGVAAGALGRGEAKIVSKLPVSLAVKMPLEVSSGDRIRLPVTLANESPRPVSAKLEASFGKAFAVRSGPDLGEIALAPGQRRAMFVDLDVVGTGLDESDGAIRIAAIAANLKDEVERTIKVAPRGFPQELSVAGTVADKNRHEIVLPRMLPGTLKAELVMYPSPLATMISGTDSIIREPVGCFEQASSANYPNIMVLGYLEENGNADPALIDRTQGMLDRGYKKLTGYESPKKGYEWFGGDPGHEALTAYGLMEFVDMTRVYSDVDQSMVKRTAAWLKKRRDGKGGYQRNSRALDSFGSASPAVTNAYITYALAVSGDKDIDVELAAAEKVASKSSDPYIAALSAGSLLAAGRDVPGNAAVKRLVSLQKEDGSFSGADHSITRSGGVALTIESTSLAALAMMASGHGHDAALRRAITWLNDNRNGFGGYGSTQSTVLALKAMTAYAGHSRMTRTDGVATVIVNGEQVGRIAYAKGHEGELRFDLAGQLKPGKNVVEVMLDSKEALPYSAAITYSSNVPASSKEAAVSLATTLGSKSVALGEGVQMKVTVENRRAEGIPMAIARVGLPGGLTFQTWQLKELRDKGLIDFYETREREVVLYFRSMAPSKVVNLDLELLAQVPGKFTAPASRAYLYYTDEHKDWAAPSTIEVTE